MADHKRNEIQNALEKQVQEIDKNYLRPIQKEMFECSANCCDNKTGSMREVNSCLEQCSAKLDQSQNYVSSQLNNYQVRLQRCVSQCNDEAKDTLGANPSQSEVDIASKAFETCACNCIDKHLELLPKFIKSINEVLHDKLPKAQ